MFTPGDKGKEVKVTLLNGDRIRGHVSWTNKGQVGIETEEGTVALAFDHISTVTWIGDFS